MDTKLRAEIDAMGAFALALDAMDECGRFAAVNWLLDKYFDVRLERNPYTGRLFVERVLRIQVTAPVESLEDR